MANFLSHHRPHTSREAGGLGVKLITRGRDLVNRAYVMKPLRTKPYLKGSGELPDGLRHGDTERPGSPPSPPLPPTPCVSSIGLLLSFIPPINQGAGKSAVFLSSVRCASKLSDPWRGHGNPRFTAGRSDTQETIWTPGRSGVSSLTLGPSSPRGHDTSSPAAVKSP